MQKIYYCGYYGDPSPQSNREITPAADTKMTYIIESMKNTGFDVEVLSFSAPEDRSVLFRKNPGYDITRNGTRVVFFDSYTSKFRILRVIGRWLSWLKVKCYLRQHCLNDECRIVIYHSLGLLKVINFLHRKKKSFVLEMEEIYADVTGESRIRNRELAAAQKASGYIFPTQLLSEIVNPNGKPEVIIHGTYAVEPDRGCNIFDQSLQEHSGRMIHCVYAGTLDPRKGGAVAAAAAAEFLPENYHIHILGFGSDLEIQNMKDLISDIASRSKAKVSYDGLLSGEDYIRFTQSCDIGLSTQNPDAAFNATSFPSKILSYMANGLRVVSIRIPAIEQSAVGDALFYYDRQTSEEIAKAILSVDICEEYDSRRMIAALSAEFEQQMDALLNRA